MPTVPPCPDYRQRGAYAGPKQHADGTLFDVYVCHGFGGCTVGEYVRGHVISRRPEEPEQPPTEG